MSDTSEKENQAPQESDLVAQLAACQKERDEYLNGWKRAKADLLNNQKEEQRRATEMLAFANLTFSRDVLSGMDSFDLALAGSGLDEAAKKGMVMIKSQFEEILKRHDIKRIPIKLGDPFNGLLHEAIGEKELDVAHADWDGKVAEELAPGYMLGERVIRPAKVKIGKRI